MNTNTQYYRWFATPYAIVPVVPGPFVLTAGLEDADLWTALQATSEDSRNPNEGHRMFREAIDYAENFGFVFGGGTGEDAGWGHGFIATAPARIIVTKVEIL